MRGTSTGSVAAAIAGSAVALGGCSVHAQEPAGYVEISSAPYGAAYPQTYVAYPHTYYDGRTVYLVDDRWMYRDQGRWYHYVQEPPALYQRRPYVYQTTPVYGSPAYGSPAYGSPAYGSPAYGSPAYGSPRYRAPASVPPAYGQPSYGQPYRTPAQPRVAPPTSAPPATRIP